MKTVSEAFEKSVRCRCDCYKNGLEVGKAQAQKRCIGRVGKLKRNKDQHTPNCQRGTCENKHFFCWSSKNNVIHNQAISDVIKLLKQE